MKQINIPFLSLHQPAIYLESSEKWTSLPTHPVDVLNWTEFPYKPDVCFSMAYSVSGIFLKFWVKEEGVRGTVTEDQGTVFKDSCVELFIDPSGDGSYYNFEFNCIGTLLLGYGTSRHNREKASGEILCKVLRSASLGLKQIDQVKGTVEWDLAVFIPFEAFFNHQIESFSGKTLCANFQKCGDSMAVPHFVTWNPIVTIKPDYHRPEFFGELHFD